MYIISVYTCLLVILNNLDSSSSESSSSEEEVEEEEDKEEDVVKVINTAGNTSIGQWEEHTNVCIILYMYNTILYRG